METINDRIEQIINQNFEGNKSAFTQVLGMKRTVISSYLGKTQRSKPGIDIIVRIIKNLDVDPYWLLTGKSKSKHKGVHIEGNNYTANSYNLTGHSDVQNSKIAEPGSNNSADNDELVKANNEIKLLKQKIEVQNKLLAEKDKVIESKDFIIKVLSANKG